MNRLRFIAVFLTFLYLFPFTLSAREPSSIVGDTFEETKGRGLEIRTNPSGVRVFINGVERGLTPIIFENLPAGEHHIRLSRDGYKDRRFNATVFTTSRLVVSIEMEEERGLVYLSVHRSEGSPGTQPLNPQIFTNTLDDIANGVTLSHDNKALLSLPTGYRTIRARAFGWEDAWVTVLVNEHNPVTADIFMRPAAFRLGNAFQSRRRFNPLNSSNLGITEFRFEVSAPGSGIITIYNNSGFVVWERQLDTFDTWLQSVSWNGRDSFGRPLPEGIYTVVIETSAALSALLPAQQESSNNETTETFSVRLETEIDYSLSIFPLSLESGISGLTFTPLPHVLPARSYQIDASLLYGKFFMPSANSSGTNAVPFLISMRISPFKKLELSTSFNINPYIEKQTGWGVSGSVKYNILNGSAAVPVAFAASLSYAWKGKAGEYPLSPGGGVGLHSPVSLELNSSVGQFSIALCPTLFWRGPAEITPELLLSAGVLYRHGWINAGLSMRYEFDFSNNANSRFLAGIEAKLFPPPSNLIFSLRAGLTNRGQRIGGYGGLGIGVIY